MGNLAHGTQSINHNTLVRRYQVHSNSRKILFAEHEADGGQWTHRDRIGLVDTISILFYLLPLSFY